MTATLASLLGCEPLRVGLVLTEDAPLRSARAVRDRLAGRRLLVDLDVLYDLPATTQRLAEGASTRGGLPEGAQQGPNDFGERAYGGVCPPAGDRAHRYRVTLWALKASTLGAPTGASAALDRLPHRG